MTVPLDMGLTSWMGMTFSLVGKEKLDGMEAGESLLTSKPYKNGLVFATVGMAAAILFYREGPDWMLMYYADHEKIPKPVRVGMFGIYPAMYNLGFFLARELEKKKKRLGWAAWAATFAGELAYIVTSWNRLFTLGTTEEYERGETRSIFETPMAPILLVGMPLAFVALYFSSKRAAQTEKH